MLKYPSIFLILLVSAAQGSAQQPVVEELFDASSRVRLEALERDVPNLMARESLASGQWSDYEYRVRTTEPREAASDQRVEGRFTIVEVTQTEITVQVENGGRSRVEVQPRTFFFSPEAIVQGLAGGGISGSLRRIEIKEARYRGTEEILVLGERLRCGKVSIELEFEMTVQGVDMDARAEMVWWYHESVPLNGLVKVEWRTHGEVMGQRFDQSITQTLVAIGSTPDVSNDGISR